MKNIARQSVISQLKRVSVRAFRDIFRGKTSGRSDLDSKIHTRFQTFVGS